MKLSFNNFLSKKKKSDHGLYTLKLLERRIMGRISDAVDQLDAKLEGLRSDIEAEIQQVKDAVGAGDQSEANAAADRVLSAVGKIGDFSAELKADDKVEAPAPVETPAPVEAPVETPAEPVVEAPVEAAPAEETPAQ